MSLFQEIIYRPIFNLFALIYHFLPIKDFGLAVILLTILIRFLLYPLTLKSLKSQKEIADFQKEIEEIRKKKQDREEEAKALISLYKKRKINPFGSFFILLIQIPILVALFRLFSGGFKETENIYPIFPKISSINPTFFGLVDLSRPNIFFAFLAGISQFFQSSLQSGGEKMSKISRKIQNQLVYFSAILAFLFLLRLPAALGLYLIFSSVFSIFQQKILEKNARERGNKSNKKNR